MYIIIETLSIGGQFILYDITNFIRTANITIDIKTILGHAILLTELGSILNTNVSRILYLLSVLHIKYFVYCI